MVWEAGQTVPLKVNRGDAGKIHTSGSSHWASGAEPALQEAGPIENLSSRPWGKCAGRWHLVWVSQ